MQPSAGGANVINSYGIHYREPRVPALSKGGHQPCQVPTFQITSTYVLQGFSIFTSLSAGHLARVEEGRSAFKNVTGKSTGNRSLGGQC